MRQAAGSIDFDSRFHRTKKVAGYLFAAGNATGFHQLRGMAAKQLLELYRDVPQIPSAGP